MTRTHHTYRACRELSPQEDSPFLGEIRPGSEQASICNGLFRAPIFKHYVSFLCFVLSISDVKCTMCTYVLRFFFFISLCALLEYLFFYRFFHFIHVIPSNSISFSFSFSFSLHIYVFLFFFAFRVSLTFPPLYPLKSFFVCFVC